MDLFSALRNELFRPFASVVLPGALALAPFMIIACNAIPEVRQFYVSQPTWFMLAFIAAGTVVGMLLEDIGSSIERGIDRCIDLEYLHGHEQVWLSYLSCGTTDNNGRRFLGATVTRLKFINSLMPAISLFVLGIFFLNRQTASWSSSSIATLFGLSLALCCWLFRVSTELSEVASTTRYCLLAPADRPKEYDVNAAPVRRVRHFAYAIGEILTSRVSDLDLRGRNPLAVVPLSIKLFLGLTKTAKPVDAP